MTNTQAQVTDRKASSNFHSVAKQYGHMSVNAAIKSTNMNAHRNMKAELESRGIPFRATDSVKRNGDISYHILSVNYYGNA